MDFIVPEGLGFFHEGKAEGFGLLIRVVKEAGDGNAVGGDFNILEVFVFVVRCKM